MMNLDQFEDGDIRNSRGLWTDAYTNREYREEHQLNISLNEIMTFSEDRNHRFLHCPIFLTEAAYYPGKLRFNLDFFPRFTIEKLTPKIFKILSDYIKLNDIKEFWCRDIILKDAIFQDFFEPIKDSIKVISFTSCEIPEIHAKLFSDLNLDSLYLVNNKISQLSNTLGLDGIRRLNHFTFVRNVYKNLVYDDLSFFKSQLFEAATRGLGGLEYRDNVIGKLDKNNGDLVEIIFSEFFKRSTRIHTS